MKKWRLLSALILLPALVFVCQAQQSAPPAIRSLNTNSEWHSVGNTNYFRNGFLVSNNTATVTMDSGIENELTGEVVAQGDVTILDHGHIWRGTNFVYNFKTGDVRASTFKSVQEPFSLAGAQLTGNSNNIYTATNAVITTDDYATAGLHHSRQDHHHCAGPIFRGASRHALLGKDAGVLFSLLQAHAWSSIRTIGNSSRATAAFSGLIC